MALVAKRVIGCQGGCNFCGPVGMARHSFQNWFWSLWTWALGKSQVGNSMCFDSESIGALANLWRGRHVLVDAMGVERWCVCSWLVGLDGVRVSPFFVYSFEAREGARHVLNCGAQNRKSKTYDTRNSRYHLRGGAASEILFPAFMLRFIVILRLRPCRRPLYF